MFPLLNRERDNPLELFQIWLNLPRKSKMVPPYFSMLWSDTIPTVSFKDGQGLVTTVTLRAGQLGDVIPPAPPPNSWASDPANAVAIWTIRMPANAEFTLPAGAAELNRALYFFRGESLQIGGQNARVRSHLVLRSDAAVLIKNGSQEAELLMLQGRPINEPVVSYGPFVMNTRDEIHEAYADYQRTRFGGWPWSRHDPVHGGTPERFAKREDGTVERPG
jgi:hypothetical protein